MKITRLVLSLCVLPGLAALFFSAAAATQAASTPAISKTDVRAAATLRQNFYREIAHIPPPSPQWPAWPARLQKYLDAWPTPGATAAEAWPEEGAEGDEDHY